MSHLPISSSDSDHSPERGGEINVIGYQQASLTGGEAAIRSEYWTRPENITTNPMVAHSNEKEFERAIQAVCRAHQQAVAYANSGRSQGVSQDTPGESLDVQLMNGKISAMPGQQNHRLASLPPGHTVAEQQVIELGREVDRLTEKTRTLEERVRRNKDKAKKSESRAKQMEERSRQMEERARQMEERARHKEERAKQREERTRQIEVLAREAEERAKQNEERARKAEQSAKVSQEQQERLRVEVNQLRLVQTTPKSVRFSGRANAMTTPPSRANNSPTFKETQKRYKAILKDLSAEDAEVMKTVYGEQKLATEEAQTRLLALRDKLKEHQQERERALAELRDKEREWVVWRNWFKSLQAKGTDIAEIIRNLPASGRLAQAQEAIIASFSKEALNETTARPTGIQAVEATPTQPLLPNAPLTSAVPQHEGDMQDNMALSDDNLPGQAAPNEQTLHQTTEAPSGEQDFVDTLGPREIRGRIMHNTDDEDDYNSETGLKRPRTLERRLSDPTQGESEHLRQSQQLQSSPITLSKSKAAMNLTTTPTNTQKRRPKRKTLTPNRYSRGRPPTRANPGGELETFDQLEDDIEDTSSEEDPLYGGSPSVRRGSTSKRQKTRPTHRYQEVVRKADERKKMKGRSCPQCIKFKDVVGPVKQLPELGVPESPNSPWPRCNHRDDEEDIDPSSRHRSHFPHPKSPPGFWLTDFPNTQEVDALNEMARQQRQAKPGIYVDETA